MPVPGQGVCIVVYRGGSRRGGGVTADGARRIVCIDCSASVIGQKIAQRLLRPLARTQKEDNTAMADAGDGDGDVVIV